jgi:threonine dehydrogenase-like Zn-dependent dehydrogenase
LQHDGARWLDVGFAGQREAGLAADCVGGGVAGGWEGAQVPVAVLDRELPQTMGHEAAGVVDELGEGVADVAVGDRVFGLSTKGGGPDPGTLTLPPAGTL